MPTRHARLEERSLALHREIARRPRQNPEVLAGMRERLANDINGGRFSRSVMDAMQEWLGLFDANSLEQPLQRWVDPGKNARRLRQSTPFAGILTQEERRARRAEKVDPARKRRRGPGRGLGVSFWRL